MGRLNGVAEIDGLENLLTPFLAAVIGHGVLMQSRVVHGIGVADVVMAQRSLGYNTSLLLSSAALRCAVAPPVVPPLH